MSFQTMYIAYQSTFDIISHKKIKYLIRILQLHSKCKHLHYMYSLISSSGKMENVPLKFASFLSLLSFDKHKMYVIFYLGKIKRQISCARFLRLIKNCFLNILHIFAFSSNKNGRESEDKFRYSFSYICRTTVTCFNCVKFVCQLFEGAILRDVICICLK